jgi:hypothetical protein
MSARALVLNDRACRDPLGVVNGVDKAPRFTEWGPIRSSPGRQVYRSALARFQSFHATLCTGKISYEPIPILDVKSQEVLECA